MGAPLLHKGSRSRGIRQESGHAQVCWNATAHPWGREALAPAGPGLALMAFAGATRCCKGDHRGSVLQCRASRGTRAISPTSGACRRGTACHLPPDGRTGRSERAEGELGCRQGRQRPVGSLAGRKRENGCRPWLLNRHRRLVRTRAERKTVLDAASGRCSSVGSLRRAGPAPAGRSLHFMFLSWRHLGGSYASSI